MTKIFTNLVLFFMYIKESKKVVKKHLIQVLSRNKIFKRRKYFFADKLKTERIFAILKGDR